MADDIKVRVVIGADAGALETGMAAALAAVQTATQRMRAQLIGLGATARQVQAQIGSATAQVGATVQAPVEHTWQKFSSPIEHSISSALTDAILGIRQKGGLREVMLGIEKSAVGGMMNNVVKNIGSSLLKPMFTSMMGMGGIGGGIANFLFNSGTETTKISLLTSMNLFLGEIAGSSAATAAATATSGVTSGAGGIFSAIGSIPVIGGIAKGIGSFLGIGGGSGGAFTSFADFTAVAGYRGGIVPSAAGGWSLPAFAGAMPAVLHSREMVLPADISEGLQGMIRGGGAGDVHVHNHFHGPADGASVGRWFANNRGHLAATVRDAWNSGALAFP